MAEYKKPKTQADVVAAFEEIHPTMNATLAYNESARCLYCYDAPCVQACPTSIDIPLFIRQIHTGSIEGAAKTIYESNYFGNICGKVCPTEVLCEGACVYNNEDAKPIEIGRLQSFATSNIIKENKQIFNKNNVNNGRKVAVIGAGPAGISCACELRSQGYTVDIFEAKSHPSGLALYGCAPYKVINEDVLDEINFLQKQFGFDIHYNNPIDTVEKIKELEGNYDSIFLGIGLGKTKSLNLENAHVKNCIGATEFIEQVKLNPLDVKVGKRVVVIGGGNTAMDAASECARLGAKEVTLAYRRPKAEMGAYGFEYDLAKSVGVKGLFSVSPLKVHGKKKVKGVVLVKTEVDQDGYVMNQVDSNFMLKCDMVILATGQEKQTSFLEKIDGLSFDNAGKIEVDPETMQTTNPLYFAAGDAVNGGMEVVNACADGKKAAKAMHLTLTSSPLTVDQ